MGQTDFKTHLKGQVACRADKDLVEGKVRLITVDYSDMESMDRAIGKMQQGEILVAKFTAPELTEALSKAGAIITDMGGILSHAAIVAREFNIPCIVGTNHATDVLKTGDSVRMDLTTGEVKIEKCESCDCDLGQN